VKHRNAQRQLPALNLGTHEPADPVTPYVHTMRGPDPDDPDTWNQPSYTITVDQCLCDEPDCMFLAVGYPFCRPCGDHHRPPECAVDAEGYALVWCGCRWDDLEPGGPGHACEVAQP
jgi:hypothetical protein